MGKGDVVMLQVTLWDIIIFLSLRSTSLKQLQAAAHEKLTPSAVFCIILTIRSNFSLTEG